MTNRGTHAEYSRLFEQAQAPTVRVEFGNIADDRDRARLLDDSHLNRLATGIASGIRKFYLLGQGDDETAALNLGTAVRQ